jgi:two-component system, LytTR family, sensor kinase
VIDNAIKHNIVQASTPLTITIKNEGSYLLIHNNKQLRKQIETSNGQGVQQLKQLYSYLTGLPVIVENKDDYYLIKIPLI